MTNIVYFLKDHGGCSFYRAIMPLDMLHEQKLASVMRMNQGDDLERLEVAFQEADVVLFPRAAPNDKMLRIMNQLKEDGKLVVVDYDDNVFKVTPLSPHYADYGLVEYQHVIRDENGNKKRLNVWKDGVTQNFSIRRNRERLEAVKRALGTANLVTTTTELLADVLREFNPNVAVLPNCVDLKRWQPLPLKPHDEFRIFWAGGSSHFEDLQIIGPVLPVIMQRFPQVRLVLMGVKFEGIVKDLPQDRVEFHLWEDSLSYPYKCAMLDADLAIIPLLDNPFNRCKSALKWVEQSALGVPSVVSYVSPYKEMYDGENSVMVENKPETWIEAISTMVVDPVLRAKIGGNAQRYVEDRYDIRKRAIDWLSVYESAHPNWLRGVGSERGRTWQLAKSVM